MFKFVPTTLKGMAMGMIDIVPGVSGSTVAVLLGFYERFITALKNIDAELISATFAPIRHAFSAESRRRCRDTWARKDMPWLAALAAGMACAMLTASFFIPWLMEHHPALTRGFFFGLVLGSAIQPILTLQRPRILEIAVLLLCAVSCFLLLGQNFHPPVSPEILTIPDGATAHDMAAMLPSTLTPDEILHMPQNAHLLNALPAGSTQPLARIPLPPGARITLPVVPLWFCFTAGFCAICAMLLPGISGSFILLVLGIYYCLLNSAKFLVLSLAHGAFSTPHFLTIVLAALGAVAGMAAFSRALTWLFTHHKRTTYAAITGILLGCLRAVWPFKDDASNNILPTANFPSLPFVILAALVALSLVALSLKLQSKKS